MILDDRERKLVLLALDSSAQPGEAAGAAAALFRSFKKRYADGYKFLAELGAREARNQFPSLTVNYGLVTLPFGKHKGRRLRDVPPDYLLWMVRDCDCLTNVMREAIKRFLRDSDFR
jgi:hypothetical protein